MKHLIIYVLLVLFVTISSLLIIPKIEETLLNYGWDLKFGEIEAPQC